MASNYPSGLDSFTNPAGTDNLAAGIGHAAQHANANDAIEAIEGELGLNPRGGSATVKARFDAIEANGWVTNARVADATITDAKLDHARVTFSNTSVVCAATTRVLVQTGTMSASRSVTLPAANAVSAGTEIVVVDESGSVTTTNTIVITRAGSDTINGAASVSIGAAYGWRRLISDGTSKWSVDGGVVRLSDSGTITSGMIADGTITGTDIASGTITSANITDATITGADIASGTVTSTNILDGTIVNADINASAAIDKTKISGTAVTVADSGTVTSAMIADGTITGTDIASGTVTSTNILDGTIVNADINASAAIDVSKLSGVVTSAGVGNLLTANQASVETDTTGFNDPFQCTLARTTAAALSGSASLLVTSTSTTSVFFTPLGTSGVSVTPGRTYTATASAKAVGNSGSGRVSIRWHNAGGSTISDVNNGSYTTITSAGWTQLSPLVAVAPADAAFATVYFGIGGINNADAFYFDCFGFWEGAGGLWALPGTPIANLGTYTDESVGRRIFTWDNVNSRWQMTYGDTGFRSLTLTPINICASLTVNVRRFGSTCHIDVSWTSSAMTLPLADTALTSTPLPSGFLPNDSVPRPGYTGYAGTIGGVIKLASGTGILSAEVPTGGMGAGGGSAMQASWEYSTTDAWPTSLPGSASGSIPYA